jgi:hypothetical protein
MSNAGKPEKPAQKTTPARQAKTPAEAGTASAKPVLPAGRQSPDRQRRRRRAGASLYPRRARLEKRPWIKFAFFCGTALTPIPPGDSKNAETRYFHIYGGEVLLEDWVRQASTLPGEKM